MVATPRPWECRSQAQPQEPVSSSPNVAAGHWTYKLMSFGPYSGMVWLLNYLALTLPSLQNAMKRLWPTKRYQKELNILLEFQLQRRNLYNANHISLLYTTRTNHQEQPFLWKYCCSSKHTQDSLQWLPERAPKLPWLSSRRSLGPALRPQGKLHHLSKWHSKDFTSSHSSEVSC